jgi:lipid-A-disaccharide synthase
MAKTLFLLCGEPSGEAYAARVARAFRERHPGVPMEGIGSSRLEAEGVRLLRDYGEISVMGFADVFSRLGAIRSALSAAKARLRRRDVGAVVLVDFPDFNFRVGAAAHKRGVPVVYYVPPQVWAWRRGRAKALSRFTKGAVVLFPFEEPLLKAYGVNAVFAGHPLLEELALFLDAPPAPEAFGLPAGKTFVGLLPGSRSREIETHLPILVAAARTIAKAFPGVHFALPIATPALQEAIRRGTREAGLPLTLVSENRHLLFRCLDAAVAVSGTATLELALMGVPSVIVFRTSWVTYRVVRALAKVSCIGLPNIVAEETFLPELIQDACTPARIADATAGILADPGRRGALRAKCLSLRERLAGSGPTDAVVSMLEREAEQAWA